MGVLSKRLSSMWVPKNNPEEGMGFETAIRPVGLNPIIQRASGPASKALDPCYWPTSRPVALAKWIASPLWTHARVIKAVAESALNILSLGLLKSRVLGGEGSCFGSVARSVVTILGCPIASGASQLANAGAVIFGPQHETCKKLGRLADRLLSGRLFEPNEYEAQQGPQGGPTRTGSSTMYPYLVSAVVRPDMDNMPKNIASTWLFTIDGKDDRSSSVEPPKEGWLQNEDDLREQGTNERRPIN